jgi:glycosyltransferase involved in cell wall biosynthesis
VVSNMTWQETDLIVEERDPASRPAVSVVVCTHTDRRIDLLLDCVRSLSENSPAPREIVVVVDSNPSLLATLHDLSPAGVTLLPSRGAGVSEARNTGIEAASGDIVAFIDDDATADDAWLRELCGAMDDPGIVAVGGRIVPRWEQPNLHLPDELLWVVGCTYTGHPVEAQPISRPIGCNMAARRSALVEVGGFRREFGPSGPLAKSHSNEEIALALQLRSQYGDESIWYSPNAVVNHYVPAARSTWRYLWHRCVAEGKSKADVRLLHGARSMAFDNSYARETLLPAIWRYAIRGVVQRDGTAVAKAAVGAGGLLVTATAYGTRAMSRRFRTSGS